MAGFHLLSERAAIAVRIEHANDARKARLDRPTPRITRRGHRTHGGAVIRTIARDNLLAAGKKLRHFHGVFIGFGAAQCEKGFGQPRDFSKLFAEQSARFCGKARSGEAQFVDLLLDSLAFWDVGGQCSG